MKKSKIETAPALKAQTPDTPAKAKSKLELMAALLDRSDGASLADLMDVTGWQAHSVRGAIAGGLKKKGLNITSEKTEGARHYRIVKALPQ